MSDKPLPETVEKPYGRITKYPDGMMKIALQDDLSIDVELARQMVFDVRSIARSDQIRLMVVYGANSDLTFGAQRYFSTVTGFTHVAFVVHTRLQAEVGQFLVSLLRVLRSSYEFTLFYEEEAAAEWLREQ